MSICASSLSIDNRWSEDAKIKQSFLPVISMDTQGGETTPSNWKQLSLLIHTKGIPLLRVPLSQPFAFYKS